MDTRWENVKITKVDGDILSHNTFHVNAPSRLKGLEEYCVQAEYDRANQCHKNTRSGVIKEVIEWARNTDASTPQIFWLYGMGGEGKSSIATSIACRLHDDDEVLGASFFFSGNIDDRSRPDKVFTSIAHLLACRHGPIEDTVCDALKTNPQIARAPATNQFHDLILKPLQKAEKNLDATKPIVVVLDALDECRAGGGRKDLVASFTNIPELPSIFKFFISSRPENDIKIAFDGMGPSVLHHDLSVGISRDTVNDDISRYFDSWREEMKLRYPGPCGSDDWPGKQKLRSVIHHAGGLFIWVDTAMKFIDDYDVNDPNGQLQLLLDDMSDVRESDSPAAVLDRLYLSVLERAFTGKASSDSLKQFQRVIGAILSVKTPLSPSVLGDLLYQNLDKDRAIDQLYGAVSKLRSVLFVPSKERADSQPIRIIHESFSDFMASGERSTRFSLDRLTCHAEAMSDCIQILTPHLGDHEFHSATLRYAFWSWSYHLNHVLTAGRNRKDLKSECIRSAITFLRKLIRQVTEFEPRAVHVIFDQGTGYHDMATVIRTMEPKCDRKLSKAIKIIFKDKGKLDQSLQATQVGGFLQHKVRISKDDIIIAVMGPTGAGKSSFINIATSSDSAPIGSDLMSVTRDVAGFRCRHPHRSNQNVVFLDTPGFNDADRSDIDVLTTIIDWLEVCQGQGKELTGVLYLHPIVQTRITNIDRSIFSIFKKLCGQDALQNAILVTTKWNKVHEDVGTLREKNLRETHWKDILAAGCKIARFDNTYQSAWAIVNQFPGTRCELELRIDMPEAQRQHIQNMARSALDSNILPQFLEVFDLRRWGSGG